ncbi:MAG TPA: hypothetical protein PLR26_02325 [Bacilli bacterium]|nr:hypothetical protein [Bacilli bacterium]
MKNYKNSILFTITSIISSLISAIFGLILIRLIILHTGSNYNGLNITISQFVNSFILLEGGITVIFSYYLFKPIVEKNHHEINKLLSYAKKKYFKIGLVVLFISIPSSIIYSFFIKTDITFYEIILLFAISIAGIWLNISLTIKYRLILEANNNEYIIQLITITVLIVVNIASIYILVSFKSYILVRLMFFLGQLLNYLLLRFVVSKMFRYIKFDNISETANISGSKDMYLERVIGSLYDSSFVFYSSIFIGTIFLSIFAIYNTIIGTIKNLLTSVVNGPRIYFGRLIAQNDMSKFRKQFMSFQLVLNVIALTLGSSLIIMLTPFVSLYTKGITDANYYSTIIPYILSITMVLHIMCTPLGNIIILSGHFKASRQIQITTFLILITTLLLTIIFKKYDLSLYSLLISELFLFGARLVFSSKKVLNINYKNILSQYLPNIIVSFVLILLFTRYLPIIDTYYIWFFWGVCTVSIFLLINILVVYIFNKKNIVEIIQVVRKGIAK